MEMRIMRFCWMIAGPLALVAAIGCQSAKKPVSALPAHKPSPPPIQQTAPAAKAVPAPEAKPVAPPPARQATVKPPEPKPDAVDELIARAEKDYQAGLAQ